MHWSDKTKDEGVGYFLVVLHIQLPVLLPEKTSNLCESSPRKLPQPKQFEIIDNNLKILTHDLKAA